MKLLLALAFALFATTANAQQTSMEDQVRTCEAVLGNSPAAVECAKVFKTSADCCIQYDEQRLLKACGAMSSIDAALTCFSEIHEVGFWKSELLPENQPGLADQFIQQWKKNVIRVCSMEPTKQKALECAVLQKSGTRFAYSQKNEEIARQSVANDPIFRFCRKTFGDYWEGVEKCVNQQRAAKKRLGQ
ncbi:hypothetical protein [Shinella sp.]|uniref:hypothetical protein n=1 Tax=Shinella sp. TaxID=1870904 RepID=UPI003F6FBD36